MYTLGFFIALLGVMPFMIGLLAAGLLIILFCLGVSDHTAGRAGRDAEDQVKKWKDRL